MIHNNIHNKVKKLEKELNKRGTISKKTRADLYHTLEETSHSMKKLRDLSRSFSELVQCQISNKLCAMEEKIVYLYGKINDLFVSSELAKIIREAEDLEKSLKNEKPSSITKKIHSLEFGIKILIENFCLSQEERHELSTAQEILKRAKSLLNGTHEDTSKGISVSAALDEDEVEGWVTELWEIADLLYHGKIKQGMRQFRQIPESLKKILNIHETRAPAIEPELRIVQALIATSYELVNTEGVNSYPSAKEIEKLFTELDDIRAS